MRLIDADALLKKIWEQRHEHPNAYHLSNYAELLACEAPTVDAVEVVRCKDCRFYEENAESRTRFCRRGLNYQYAAPDGFCSYGERSTTP